MADKSEVVVLLEKRAELTQPEARRRGDVIVAASMVGIGLPMLAFPANLAGNLTANEMARRHYGAHFKNLRGPGSISAKFPFTSSLFPIVPSVSALRMRNRILTELENGSLPKKKRK